MYPESESAIRSRAWFSPIAGWVDQAHLNQRRAYHVAAVVDEKIYAIGGIYESQWLDSVEAYDPLSDSWAYMEPMPTARCSLGAAVVDGMIYVVGGTANQNVLDIVEVYDPALDSWASCAPKPTAVAGPAVAAAQGKVWVFGGTLGWLDYRDNVEVYDPVTDTWEVMTPLPFARVFSAATTIGDRIYVIGGYNGDEHFIDTAHCLDLQSEEWTTVAPTLIGRDTPAVTIVKEGILVVGGSKEAGTGACSDVEYFNPANNEWVLTASLPAPRKNLACVNLSGFPYAVAGTPNPYASIEATNYRGVYVEAIPTVTGIGLAVMVVVMASIGGIIVKHRSACTDERRRM